MHCRLSSDSDDGSSYNLSSSSESDSSSSEDDPDFSYSYVYKRKPKTSASSSKSRSGKSEELKCRFCRFGTNNNSLNLMDIRAHERDLHSSKFIQKCKTCQSTFVTVQEVRTCQESHRNKSTYRNDDFNCFVCEST